MTTVLAGDIILADQHNELESFAVPLVAVKSADEGRTSSSTSADADLKLTIPAGRTYAFEIQLYVKSAANNQGDFLCDLSWTGTATYVSAGASGPHNSLASGSQADLESAAAVKDATSPSAPFVFGASTAPNLETIRGTIVASTQCVLTLNWGLFTASGTTTLMETSSFVAKRRS